MVEDSVEGFDHATISDKWTPPTSTMEDPSTLDLDQLRVLVGRLKDSRGHSELILQNLREELDILRAQYEEQQQKKMPQILHSRPL